MNIFMKQIIINIGCFVFVVFALTSCNLDELHGLFPRSRYIDVQFSVINKSSQDIEVEYVRNNIPQDKRKYSIAKGDTTTRKYIISTQNYYIRNAKDAIFLESIYQEFLDEVFPEKLGETPPNCSKVISRLNRDLVQLDIYDENKNKVRSWAACQMQDYSTPSRSPFYGYHPFWTENWSGEIKASNFAQHWIYFTYTITDDDLIPEESAEE